MNIPKISKLPHTNHDCIMLQTSFISKIIPILRKYSVTSRWCSIINLCVWYFSCDEDVLLRSITITCQLPVLLKIFTQNIHKMLSKEVSFKLLLDKISNYAVDSVSSARLLNCKQLFIGILPVKKKNKISHHYMCSLITNYEE